jgi:hypothetical protein
MVGLILKAAKKIITHHACLSANQRCVLLTVFSVIFSFPNVHNRERPEGGPKSHTISCSSLKSCVIIFYVSLMPSGLVPFYT